MMIRSPGPGTLMAVFAAVSCLQRVRAADSAEESVDVIEGGAVTLKCRFAPVSSDADVTLYWIRTNALGSDNAAIQNTALDTQYSVAPVPRQGRYDLEIRNSSYARDQAEFKCMMKQAGTGGLLHTSKVHVTVLVRPGPPVITPRTPVATEGEAMNISCSSEGGSPAPDIFWYMEGDSDPLRGAVMTKGRTTTSTLQILPTKVHRHFPRVSVGPYNPLMVEEGDTAAMLCEVDSNPSVSSVRWTRGGRYIATTFRHVIPTLGLSDGGLYTCEADNNLGHVARAELNVSVLHGPRVTLQRLQEVDLGSDVKVECSSLANPEPSSYTWTRGHSDTWREEGRWLVLRNVSHGDSGEYTCTASNTLRPTHGVASTRRGRASTTIAVTHEPGQSHVVPGETGLREEVAGVEGRPVTLSCVTEPPGYPPPMYKWWRTDTPSETLGTLSNLTLQQLRLGDQGRYSCQAYNTLGKGREGVGFLRVFQTPRLVTPLAEEMTRRQGETGVSLSCQARGKPAPLVTWLKDNVTLLADQEELFSVNTTELRRKGASRDKSVTVLSTLYFRGSARRVGGEIVADDVGRYSCIFSNSAGNDSSSVRLRIEHPPIVIDSLSDKKVAADVGGSVTMECGVRSHPKPSFSWARDASGPRDRAVTSLGRIMTQRDSRISDTEFLSTFTIASVKETHYGQFLCKSTNSLGSTSHVVSLVRRSRPDPPSLVEALNVNSDSVTVKWRENFHGGLNNVTFKLQYRPQDSTILYAKERLCYQNPCKISSLTQHTTYIIRVKAMNRLGESSWSEYGSVTTLIDAARIPRVSGLSWDNETSSLGFQVTRVYPLYLVARVEARMERLGTTNNTWQLIKTVPLKKKPFAFLLPRNLKFNNLRVTLCIETQPGLCGPATELTSHHKLEAGEAVPGQLSEARGVAWGHTWVIGILVGVLVTLVASLAALVKCCWCSNSRRRAKMTAAMEREKQILMSRPDILHPIDQKMLELSIDRGHGRSPHRQCAHHDSEVYTNTGALAGAGSDRQSDDSVWWIKQQQQQQQQEDCCECGGAGGGGMRDAMSLPHLASPQVFRHIAPQYYSQDLMYGTVPRRIIREIVV